MVEGSFHPNFNGMHNKTSPSRDLRTFVSQFLACFRAGETVTRQSSCFKELTDVLLTDPDIKQIPPPLCFVRQ